MAPASEFGAAPSPAGSETIGSPVGSDNLMTRSVPNFCPIPRAPAVAHGYPRWRAALRTAIGVIMADTVTLLSGTWSNVRRFTPLASESGRWQGCPSSSPQRPWPAASTRAFGPA